MQRLPSTAALQMFVAAARAESFVHAAAMLNVTQAAVSKQIKQLELLLEASLFERGHKHVRLTQRGLDYLPVAEQVIGVLANSSPGAEVPAVRGELVIEIDPELLHFWLLPRLPDLQKVVPDLHLRFLPAPHKARRPGPEVDIGLVFGRPPEMGLRIRRLMDFVVFPVCSPAYAKAQSGIGDRLGELDLLHDFDRSWWDEVLSAAGRERSLRIPEITLGQPIHSLHAAERGLGLVVGDDIVCRDSMERGELIRPMDLKLPGREEFFVVTHRTKPKSRATQTVIDWFVAQAKEQKSWRKRFVVGSDVTHHE